MTFPTWRNRAAHPDGLSYSSRYSGLAHLSYCIELISHLFRGDEITLFQSAYRFLDDIPESLFGALKEFALYTLSDPSIWMEGQSLLDIQGHFAAYVCPYPAEEKATDLVEQYLAVALDVAFGKEHWVLEDIVRQDEEQSIRWLFIRGSEGFRRFKQGELFP